MHGEDGAARAAAICELDLNGASVAFYNFLHYPKTESGTHIFLGGKERLKDSLRVLLRHSRAIVLNNQMHHGPIGALLAQQPYGNDAVVRARGGRIGNQVRQYLIHLPTHDVNGRAFAKISYHSDIFCVELVGIERQHRVDERRNLNQHGGAGFSIKSQRLPG